MSPAKKKKLKTKKKSSVSKKAKSRSTAKGPATTLIQGAQVIDVEAGTVEALDILICDGRIEKVGKRISSRGVGEVVKAKGLVAMPGFVQVHMHLCQTLFRSQAEDMDLLTWLRERIWPMEGALTPEDMRASARLGIAELLLGGTTCVLDMGTVRHTEVLFEEAKRQGLRYAGGKAIMDQGQGYPAGLRETTEQAVCASLALCEHWHGAANGRIKYAFAPRFVLSCSEEAIRSCVEYARQHGALLHTHASENSEEVSLVRERTGMGNVEYLHHLGFTGDNVVMAHGIWLSNEERKILQQTGTCIAHCPSANLKLGSGIARVPELLAGQVKVAMGADGAACNNRLDAFTEMRTAALLHNARGGVAAISAKVALRLATLEGARALGWHDVGNIREGYRADIVLLDLRKPHTWPELGDMFSRIVFSAQSSDVHSVFVEGQTLVSEGMLT
jgi:cytosine/adenosine deaminase-related metal-dependent hydrolase